jgi:hypothetical protein
MGMKQGMIDLFDLKMHKRGLAERRKRMLEARRRDLSAGASLVLQHREPESRLPQVTMYRLTPHEAEVVILALLEDLDEQIIATSKEIEGAASSAYPRRLAGGAWAVDRSVLSEAQSRTKTQTLRRSCGYPKVDREDAPKG